MPASLRKIAKIAKTSDMTVLRALRGENNVRPELRDRIIEVAKELRYEKNLLVNGILNNRSHNITILIPDSSAGICPRIIRGAQDGLKLRGYRSFVFNSDGDAHVEFEEIRQAAMRRVDGLLLMTDQDIVKNGHFDELVRRRIPTVCIGRPKSNNVFEVFASRDEEYGYLITRKMIEMGHRKIAHIGIDEDRLLGCSQTDGWKRALSEAGMDTEDMLVYTQRTDIDAVAECVEKWLRSKICPTAIFTGAETQAAGIYKVAQRLGVCIGKEISIVSFLTADAQGLCRYMDPKLAGYIMPDYELGRLASNRLIDMIENKDWDIRDSLGKINEVAAIWNDGESLNLPVGLITSEDDKDLEFNDKFVVF